MEENKKKKKIDEKDLVFHYSRSRRLENASETVRKLNQEGPRQRFSLVRPLTSSKPLVFLFISIILLCGISYLLTFFTGVKGDALFGGNALAISGFTFEGKTYISIKKTIKDQDNAYTGAVDIAVSPKDDRYESDPEKINVKAERVFFTLEPVEEFKMAAPFAADELIILLQSEKEIQKKTIKTK